MQMTKNMPMYEEVVPGSPGLGHIPRRMQSQDSTDMGIVQRIKQAVEQRMISPQAAQYLIENLLQGGAETAQGLRGMPSPERMPSVGNTFPYGLKNGLLGD